MLVDAAEEGLCARETQGDVCGIVRSRVDAALAVLVHVSFAGAPY